MEFKKDIGNYFKENLEQLDYSPSPKVWEGIEVELRKKKKRRFIFWMFFTLIAILGLSTYTYVNHSNSVNPPKNTVVTTETDNRNTNPNDRNSNPNNIDSNSNLNNTNPGNTILDNTKDSKNQNEIATDGKSRIGKDNVNTNSGINNNSKNGIKNKSAKPKFNTSTGLVENNIKSGKNVSAKSKTTYSNKNTQSYKKGSSALAGNKSKQSKKNKKSGKSNSSNGLEATNKNNDLTVLKIAGTDTKSSIEKEENNSGHLQDTDTNIAATSDKNKKPSLDELKKANQKKRDSLVAVRKADKGKKDLAQKPKEEEKDSTKTEETKSVHEIIIAPYFGLNYNGNLGNGNFLNDSKTSKKASQFQSSYGVLVRWMGGDKIGFQTGVGVINATYSATFEKETNAFINPSVASLDFTNEEINILFPNGTKVTSTQESSFIEIPIEGYYVFRDRKFGLATSFGLSLLILQNNKLFLESESVSRFKAGELENMSPFSFSTNVKLNLFYKISEKLQFDLYPSFQYQIMGFKEVSNYHSYFFSIKTGLSYKL